MRSMLHLQEYVPVSLLITRNPTAIKQQMHVVSVDGSQDHRLHHVKN